MAPGFAQARNVRHRYRNAALCLVVVGAGILTALAQNRPAVAGRWEWQGPAGWQRITLDLRTSGTTVTGTIAMGPGTGRAASPDDFWQYFFEPVVFNLVQGSIDGNTIAFEHVINRAVPGPNRERLRYTGTVQGDVMTLTREAGRRAPPTPEGGNDVRVSENPLILLALMAAPESEDDVWISGNYHKTAFTLVRRP